MLFESSGGQVDKVAHLPELRFALGEPDVDTTSVDTAAFPLEDKSYVTPIPKGGYYRYILDMESIGKGKSRVTYHGPQLFSSDTINALFEAAEGKNPKFCLADE